MKLRYTWAILLIIASCTQKKEITTPETQDDLVQALTAQIEKSPNDASLYIERAKTLQELNTYDLAIEDMLHAIQLDSTQAGSIALLSDLYLANAQSKEALDQLYQGVIRFPTDETLLTKMARLRLILKQHQLSLYYINELLLLDPENAEAFILMGVNLKEIEKYDEAINAFQKAADIDSDQIDAWINLGQLWGERGDFKFAKKYFETAIAIDSTSNNALFTYAKFLGDHEQYQESINTYQRIIRKDPLHAQSLFNSAIMYYMIDSNDQSVRHLTLAIKSDPTYAKAYYYRGMIEEDEGEIAKAQADYETALRLSPDQEEIAEALARLARSQ